MNGVASRKQMDNRNRSRHFLAALRQHQRLSGRGESKVKGQGAIHYYFDTAIECSCHGMGFLLDPRISGDGDPFSGVTNSRLISGEEQAGRIDADHVRLKCRPR